MKWTAMLLLLMLACAAGTMIGCESREESMPAPPAPMSDEMSEPTTDESTPTTGPATQASAALTTANQFCAVMPEHKVDAKVTVVHAGERIGFCCEDCIPTFKKEPEKYVAAMK